MPRPLLPSHVLLIQQALIPRAPGCLLTQEDVTGLCEQTGLEPAQVRKWADHFRSRTKPEARLAALQPVETPDAPVPVRARVPSSENGPRCHFCSFWQSVNALRFYVSGFNINEQLLRDFTMPKSRKQEPAQVFEIKYMDAAIDGAAFAAEFFIEFTSPVWAHKLIARLKELGAGSVHADTFAHNDQNKSAADCLVRIWTSAAKPNHQAYNRGTCTPALHARATSQLQSEREQQKAFDTKTAKAVEASLGRIGESISTGFAQTAEGLTTVAGGVDKVAEEVGEMRANIEKLSRLERENEALQKEVKYQKLLADRVEHSKGLVTRELNVALVENERLDQERREAHTKIDALTRTNAALERDNAALNKKLDEMHMNQSSQRALVDECTQLLKRKRFRAAAYSDGDA